MKDLIQEGRTIQETFKKKVVNEEGSVSAFINKVKSWYTGKKSIYGKWYIQSFIEQDDSDDDFYLVYVPKKSFFSKIKSQFAPTLQDFFEIAATIKTYKPVDAEMTIWYPRDRYIKFIKETKSSPIKVENNFPKMVMDENELISIGDMMYNELQKEVQYFLRANKDEYRKWFAFYNPTGGFHA
jgi:hypothetical protein